jgi:ribose transport system substrate-binding protein
VIELEREERWKSSRIEGTVTGFAPSHRQRTSFGAGAPHESVTRSFEKLASLLRRAVPAFMCAAILLPVISCKSSRLPVIAVIPRTTALVLWEAEHAGAEVAASKAGFRIYWNAPTSEDDVERQIAMIQRSVDRGAVGLILAPDQALALMVPVRNLVARGIPTVVISSPLAIPPGGKLSYILNDEGATGRIAAERIGLILQGRGSVAVLGIDPDITGIVNRTRAFETDLATKFPGIRIVDERTGGFNIAQAQEVTEDVLAKNSHLDAILALNSSATRGAYLALQARKQLRKIKLVACEQELIPPLVTGEIDSIIVENTYEMGYRAVQLIAAQRRGEVVPPEIQLSPKLVTRENLNTPEVQQLLTMNWRTPE